MWNFNYWSRKVKTFNLWKSKTIARLKKGFLLLSISVAGDSFLQTAVKATNKIFKLNNWNFFFKKICWTQICTATVVWSKQDGRYFVRWFNNIQFWWLVHHWATKNIEKVGGVVLCKTRQQCWRWRLVKNGVKMKLFLKMISIKSQLFWSSFKLRLFSIILFR